MKKYMVLFSFILVSVSSYAGTWTLDSRIKGVLSPESVFYHKQKKVLFVTNQNYAGKDGEGFISKHNLDGSIIKLKWVTGLVAPKGMAVVGDSLFVSAKTELVEISISKGDIIKRHQHEKAEFLNDVVSDKKGNVYVSDMFTSSIYKFTDGSFDVWMSGNNLENPNGLFIKGNSMYVSAWGSFANQKPLTASKGHFLKINMKTKEVSKVSNKAIGHLDGVLKIRKKFILSDWVSGEIFSFNKKSKSAKSIYKLTQGAGDIEYIKKGKRLMVPMAKSDEIVVLKYTK